MKLGPYEITGTLGQGGSGTVLRARDPKGREVAIKILRERRPEVIARFEREKRLLVELGEDAGFVPIVDTGSNPEVGPYVVMPFLAGGTLRGRLERERFRTAEVSVLAERLARALGAAHERGIVHRDLKPENILFTAAGEALVADLGLAKHFESTGASVSLSKTGDMRGTFAYMPLEQLEDAKSVGPQADVFALGSVLYECLAGRPPFHGDSAMEIAARLEKGEFEPLARARPDAPPVLARAIERALATRPADRFPDGNAFARALSTPEPASPARRPSWLWLGGASTVVGLALGLGLVATLRKNDAPAPSSPSPTPTARGTSGRAPSTAATLERLRRGAVEPGELEAMTSSTAGVDLLKELARDGTILPLGPAEQAARARPTSNELGTLAAVAAIARGTEAQRAAGFEELRRHRPEGVALALVEAGRAATRVRDGARDRRDRPSLPPLQPDLLESALRPLAGHPTLLARAVAVLAPEARLDFLDKPRGIDRLPRLLRGTPSLDVALDELEPVLALETLSESTMRTSDDVSWVEVEERTARRLEAAGDLTVAAHAWAIAYRNRVGTFHQTVPIEPTLAAIARARASLASDSLPMLLLAVDEYDARRTASIALALRAATLAPGGERAAALGAALDETRVAIALIEQAPPRRIHEAEDERRLALLLLVLGRAAEAREHVRTGEPELMRLLVADPLDAAALENACGRALAEAKLSAATDDIALGIRARVRRSLGDAAGAEADEAEIIRRGEGSLARLAGLAFDARAGR